MYYKRFEVQTDVSESCSSTSTPVSDSLTNQRKKSMLLYNYAYRKLVFVYTLYRSRKYTNSVYIRRCRLDSI